MGTLSKIALGVLAISFITFVALFGRLPTLRKTPIGWLQRLLCDHIPSLCRRVDRAVTGGRITASLSRTTNYLVYKKNPVVEIIFLTIVTGSAFLFLSATLSSLSALQLLPVPFVLSAPYIFTHLCAADHSIYITPSNHSARLQDYPYDHVLYRPNNICRTCELPKPARSKHCSLCGVCVARSDHHCPWVNNCLGRSNYRWFLLLLLSLGVLEIYGAILAHSILSPQLTVPDAASLSWFTRDYWDKLALAIVNAVNVGGLSIAGVGLLAATTAPLPLGLLAYHIYLVWAGMTTNETSKWADWRDDMADGIVFKAKRSVIVEDDAKRAQNGAVNGTLRPDRHLAAAIVEEPAIDWPVESDQIVVKTTDGRPPNGRENMYERIWSLEQVDNIYDLGFWDNLLYVLRSR